MLCIKLKYNTKLFIGDDEIVDNGKLMTDFGVDPEDFKDHHGQFKDSVCTAKWKLTSEALLIKIKFKNEIDEDNEDLIDEIINEIIDRSNLDDNPIYITYTQLLSPKMMYDLDEVDFTFEDFEERLEDHSQYDKLIGEDEDEFKDIFLSLSDDHQNELLEYVYEDEWGDVMLSLLIEER